MPAPALQISDRVRRVFLALAILAGVWAPFIALTGGGVLFEVRGVRVSSRNALNPALASLMCLALAWVLAPAGRRRGAILSDLGGLARTAARALTPAAGVRHLAALIAGMIAAAVVALGIWKGVPVAGGADSYGYVSQARLWATATLVVPEPLMRDLAGLVPRETLAPLGYRPAVASDAIVPTYAPGLPMVMSVFERLAGADAVFFVVPLLGGVAVCATYLMGAQLAAPAAGATAAALLATSPPFLSQLMMAESDVPATAWWALALALLLRPGAAWALGAGVAAGLAVLTRPNLVVLAIVPGLLLLGDIVASRTRAAAWRLLLFVAGIMPACVAVALLNAYWYGSPLTSGYGSLRALFDLSYLGPNLARYPRWTIEAQTPFVLLALAAPWLVTQRPSAAGPAAGPAPGARAVAAGWLLFAGVVAASYVFYHPWEHPTFLRFLLPAFPPLLALTAISLVVIAGRLPPGARRAAIVAVVALMCAQGIRTATSWGVFGYATEMKYATVGRYLGRTLPPHAVVLAMQHSGSIRYYAGLTTVRYDFIPPSRLDAVLAALRRRGREPFILLEGWEEPLFRDRFANDSAVGLLDWRPMAALAGPFVRLYDPADAAAAHERARTAAID